MKVELDAINDKFRCFTEYDMRCSYYACCKYLYDENIDH